MAKNINQPVAYPIFTFRWLADSWFSNTNSLFLRQYYCNAIHSTIKITKL
jgi:hypothetical protein